MKNTRDLKNLLFFLQSISPGSVDNTDLFETAQFKPSAQVVSSRPALKPEDVAAAIVTTLETPPRVEVGIIQLTNKLLKLCFTYARQRAQHIQWWI